METRTLLFLLNLLLFQLPLHSFIIYFSDFYMVFLEHDNYNEPFVIYIEMYSILNITMQMYYIIRRNGIVRRGFCRNVFVCRVLCALSLCTEAFVLGVARPLMVLVMQSEKRGVKIDPTSVLQGLTTRPQGLHD